MSSLKSNLVDPWQEIDKQISQAKTDFDKYTTENPRLKAENEKLNEDLFDLNRKIVNAKAELEKAKADRLTIANKSKEFISKTKEEVANLYVELDREKVKFDNKCASSQTEMDERANLLDERENTLTQRENEIVVKSKELSELTKIQQDQAEELKLAIKTLDNKAVDNAHEVAVISQRSDELDEREAKIIESESQLADKKREIEAMGKKTKENYVLAKTLKETNELTQLELDKRTRMLDNKEKDLSKRESELKSRTDNFVNSLKMGKML